MREFEDFWQYVLVTLCILFMIVVSLQDKEIIDDHIPEIETKRIIYATESKHSFQGLSGTIMSFEHPDYPGLICTTIGLHGSAGVMGCFYPRQDE